MIATRMALKLGDYALTEASFGADLSAEQFIGIKCRMGGFVPDANVLDNIYASLFRGVVIGSLNKLSLFVFCQQVITCSWRS